MSIGYDKIEITTDASGAATAYSDSLTGLLHALVYVPGTLATGADLTITDDVTGHALLAVTDAGTQAAVFTPRGATVDTANAASLYASAGEPVEDLLPIVSRVKLVVAQGGNGGAGALYVVYQD